MHIRIPSLSLLLVALSAAAQTQTPAPIEAVGPRRSVLEHCGLATAPSGDGLFGGGRDYQVRLTARGMRFEPALGRAVERTQHLALTPRTLSRGDAVLLAPSAAAPTLDGRTARYRHAPGITERYEVRSDGVALSWEFAAEPVGEGDLVVRYALDTSLPAPAATGDGLAFTAPGIGGVQVGAVTGIDALGRTVRGALSLDGDMLALSLPGEFVHTATYPLVLDPVIGSVVPVQVSANADGEPDVCYDAPTNRYLVAWLRTFSATSSAVRAQRVDVGGSPIGGTIFFATNGTVSRPRIADLRARSRFGVVWKQTAGIFQSIEFATVDAATGAIGNTVSLAIDQSVDEPDLGCETAAPSGFPTGFVAVWKQDPLNSVQARRIWFTPTDVLRLEPPVAVFTDNALLSVYSEPAISRTAASDSQLLVVARFHNAFLGASGVAARVVFAGSSALGPGVNVASSATATASAPDVDGFQGRWAVAWQSTAAGLPAVMVAPVEWDGASAFPTVGAAQTFGGSLIAQDSAPSLGYTGGRTWLGYRQRNTVIGPLTSLRVTAIDSGSCASCNDGFSVPIGGSETRIVAATMTSSGQTTGEDALAVWSDAGDVYAQRLRNYGVTGTLVDLGGGCGAGGAQSFSHAPGIGSSGLICSVSGLTPTAVATIFNFNAPSGAIPCGSCVWTPFSVTLTPPIVAGQATVQFAIPCLVSLVGAQFETQWTTVDFTQSPCPLLPGLALSPRTLLTIGQ